MDENELNELLGKIGKRVFVQYFREFGNPAISNQEMIALLPNEFTLTSRQSRTAKSRRIFREGLQERALWIVANANVEPDAAAGARALLESRKAEPVFRSPEEVEPSTLYVEGAVAHVLVNRYERDSQARTQCISQYRPVCSVCFFDFGLTYGEIAAGFIHVHHIRPLASIAASYTIDPVADLRPVCPNCHAVLHRRDPPYTNDELREILRVQNQNGRGGGLTKR
jgi:predicted HNH restriction endonuclease